MSNSIRISVKLPIMQGDIVFVPGGESPSELTGGSLLLLYPYLYKRPYVKLCEILEHIPEARIQYIGKASGMNTSRPERFIVFPDDSTPERRRTDWFGVLRRLANNEQECKPQEREKEYCNSIGNQEHDYISPHFNNACGTDDGAESLYVEEGSTINTKIQLPPLVPWQVPIKDF